MTAHLCTETPALLTAREVAQVLREITFERLAMRRADDQGLGPACVLVVDVEGWRISLLLEGHTPCHCVEALSPDGRHWALAGGERYDPAALLSTWEHAALQRLLLGLPVQPSTMTM